MKEFLSSSLSNKITTDQKLILLIIVSTLIRIILGSNIQLGNDEVYYWTYARYPDWSHFDHPPMVGILMQIFTFDLFFDNEIALRLGTIVFGSLNTMLIYFIGKEIYNARSGFIASVLFTISTYGFIISGLFVMPDAPLVFFWLLSLFFFIKYTKVDGVAKANKFLFLSFTALGLAIYSKYQAVYLFFGYLIYFIVYQRNQFKNPYLYLSLIVPIIFATIIIYWNYLNKFTGLNYHSNRVSLFSNSFNVDSFLREIFGQIAYINPFNYVLIIISLIAYKKSNYFERSSMNLLLFVSIPLILTTIFLSMFRDTLPHWSSIGYVTLLPVAAIYLSNKKRITYVYYVLFLILFLSVIGIKVVNNNWFAKSEIIDFSSDRLGKNDPTLDMFGWDQIHSKLIELELTDKKLSNLPLVSFRWYPGAHLDYYVAQPMHKEIYLIGDINAIHKYYWINKEKDPLINGQDAIYITRSRNFYPPEKTMHKYFKKSVLLSKFPIMRGGEIVEFGYIYLLKHYTDTEE